jgi:enoyl-CoA hydratase
VVTGAGVRASCAGADLNAIDELMRRPEAARTGPLGFSGLEPGKPRIAAVERFCVGGGIELACWCDLRIAGEGAEFGALNRQVGVPWVDGGTQRMTRVVGQGNALYLIETGERIGGADRVLPAAEPAGRPQGHAGDVGALAGRGVGPGVSSGPGGRP